MVVDGRRWDAEKKREERGREVETMVRKKGKKKRWLERKMDGWMERIDVLGFGCQIRRRLTAWLG
jgi:hypothetical protein